MQVYKPRKALEHLKKGDAIQASEKAYKVAEEVIKAFAEKFNLPEYQQALRKADGTLTYWEKLPMPQQINQVIGYWMAGAMRISFTYGVFMRQS